MAAFQTLDNRMYQHSDKVVPPIIGKPLPPAPLQVAYSPNGRDLSFATRLASPISQPKAPSRTSGNSGEVNGSDSDLELPLHSTTLERAHRPIRPKH